MDDRMIEKSCVNKVRYHTRESAEQAYRHYKANMPRKRGRRVQKIKHEQRPYKCGHCGGWHLARI
ncbi:MAG: hypothetical protein FWH04_08530 [Oscillospiraceae bacterium]|nr:hypothetical protein [Oscillospiraceae bacterium]